MFYRWKRKMEKVKENLCSDVAISFSFSTDWENSKNRWKISDFSTLKIYFKHNRLILTCYIDRQIFIYLYLSHIFLWNYKTTTIEWKRLKTFIRRSNILKVIRCIFKKKIKRKRNFLYFIYLFFTIFTKINAS